MEPRGTPSTACASTKTSFHSRASRWLCARKRARSGAQCQITPLVQPPLIMSSRHQAWSPLSMLKPLVKQHSVKSLARRDMQRLNWRTPHGT